MTQRPPDPDSLRTTGWIGNLRTSGEGNSPSQMKYARPPEPDRYDSTSNHPDPLGWPVESHHLQEAVAVIHDERSTNLPNHRFDTDTSRSADATLAAHVEGQSRGRLN